MRAVPGIYAFLGYDSPRAFQGIGKGKWLNITKGHEEYCNVLCLLGESLQTEDNLFDTIESMVRQGYGFLNKPYVNDGGYEKWCGEKFPKPPISPTKDNLHQHIKRVNYQAFIWQNALEANQEILEADQNGWYVIDGNYKVYWIVIKLVKVH